MKSNSLLVAAVLGLSVFASGCVNNAPRGGMQQSYNVQNGVVVGTHPATAEASTGTQVMGAVAGGVAGALLGSQIGGGSGKKVATVGGAAAGAYGGKVAADKFAGRSGHNIQVRLASGREVTIFQEGNLAYRIGHNVRVVDNGQTYSIEGN